MHRIQDDNTEHILSRLEGLKSQWDGWDILPNESIPEGNKTREPHRYGMPLWKDMYSPRQQLAHGYCVQTFRELVDEDRNAGVLDDVRRLPGAMLHWDWTRCFYEIIYSADGYAQTDCG